MHQINKLFGEKLHMVNIGVETFYQDMLSQKEAGTQDIEVIHVDWKPVAGRQQETGRYARYVEVITHSRAAGR